MSPQITTSVENNFTKGLITESTGLSFPENAATDTQNCVYTIIGDVLRRQGIDYEDNAVQTNFIRVNPPENTGAAITSYKWNNVAGDGSTQIVVLQVGLNLHFYLSSAATKVSPVSAQLIASAALNSYRTDTVVSMGTIEAQFADGNGYLFVFHPASEPFYCSYVGGTIVTTPIAVQIRDFEGVNSDTAGLYSNVRPGSLANDHQYNLYNQGWDLQKITDFNTALPGQYPSNSDIWWLFKNSTGAFDPATTADKVVVAGPAPKGYFVINAFDQIRNQTGSPLAEISVIKRPKAGAWFAGRVWYVGADIASVGAHTFSETLYFSQTIETSDQFGFCYQRNDPTSEKLFDLLATDGGVIRIQGCGVIYKLFPIQNGMLVFAANGIWFITGSQGIGFSASDYTITRISGIQSISSTSYVNVMGYPVFWNEEGIYAVAPGQSGALSVNNLCLGTILTFYGTIPLQSKKFARGDYNPIDFIIQWVYRSTNETSVGDRCQYDRILCYNTANKAFYTYTLPTNTSYIHDIRYLAGPGGSTSPDPVFKYIVSKPNTNSAPLYFFSFAEEKDDVHYKDWFTNDNVGTNYVSYFVTGYKIRGKAITKWQPGYVYMFSRNDFDTAYKIQGLWEFAVSGNSGKWSNIQVITNSLSSGNFGVVSRRHKLRGHGMSLQIKVISVDGKPFDIIGWSIFEVVNQSV